MEEEISPRLTFEPGAAATRRLRDFGLGLASIATIIALMRWRMGRSDVLTWLIAAPWPAIFALLRPSWLKPVYQVWMRAVGLIARINTFIFLGLLYFLVITPFAVISRFLGRDWLDERLRTAESYWRPKEAPRASEDYEMQF